MGLLSLIYGTKNKLKIATIDVDVCISESHETQCDITENPVEIGSTITDHVQVKPATLTIEGLVSDTPINYLTGVRNIFSDTLSKKTYEELVAIQKARQPISVITGLKQYANMILKTLSVPRNADTGKALRFNATFQEILIVESSEITVAVTGKQFNKKVGTGKLTPETPTSGVLGSAGSILSALTGLGA
jgi:hypothetical protein